MYIWLIHSAICMFYICVERMIWGVSVLASCHLCSTAVLSLPQYHLFSSTMSQRRGTDNTAAYRPANVLRWCKELLLPVVYYFSPFLTSPGGCRIFATEKDPSPSLPNGRARPLEEALNVLLCLVRGAIPIATRGQE